MVTLEQITIIRAPIERCFDLARNVEVHLAGNFHWGEAAMATGGVTTGLIGLGEQVTWQARHFGRRQRLTSEITAMTAPVYFQDTMIRGAFKSMQHDHYFRTLSRLRTEMRDVFRFSAPFGPLGKLVEMAMLRSYMDNLLRERITVIREIAESSSWQKYVAGV